MCWTGASMRLLSDTTTDQAVVTIINTIAFLPAYHCVMNII